VREHELRVRRIVESYLLRHGDCPHHTESYAKYLTKQIPDMVTESNPILIKVPKAASVHKIEFNNVRIHRPVVQQADRSYTDLLPRDAHLRRQTYSAHVVVDLDHKVYKKEVLDGVDDAPPPTASAPPPTEAKRGRRRKGVETHRYKLVTHRRFVDLFYFEIPAMLNSRACHTQGHAEKNGLFVVNGYEKVIISKERMRVNFAMVYPPTSKDGKREIKCQIRSYHTSKIRSTSTLNLYLHRSRDGSFEVSAAVPFIPTPIPIAKLFFLLGVTSAAGVEEVLTAFLKPGACSERLRAQIREVASGEMGTRSSILNLISADRDKNKNRRFQATEHVLRNELLPHVGGAYGTEEEAARTRRRKALAIGAAVLKILRVSLGEVPPDDIDCYANKRVKAAGDQLALLTRQLIRNFMKTLRGQVYKTAATGADVSLTDHLQHRSRITTSLRYCMATGNWGVQKKNSVQTGVCQVLNSANVSAIRSHKRMIDTPIKRDSKQSGPRQLHSSKYGIVCCADTPEGASVGLLNTLCILTGVRIGIPGDFVTTLVIAELGGIPLLECTPEQRRTLPTVSVNGSICGCVRDAVDLIARLRQYRRTGDIPMDASVFFEPSENRVYILTDTGECYRPLIVLSRLQALERIYARFSSNPKELWTELVLGGVVECVGKAEEARLCVCKSYRDWLRRPPHERAQFSHVDFHPSFIFGPAAGFIPFSNHNQAPRNIYQANMGKQAVSAQPLDLGMETKTHVLNYSNRPLVTTMAADALEVNTHTAGQMVVLAIMPLNGDNQEDSIIMNRSSVERGMFQSTYYRTVRAEEKKNGADIETFGKAEVGGKGRKMANYDTIQANGFPALGTVIQKNDVIIGKTIECSSAGGRSKSHVKHDQSILSDSKEKSRVQKIVITHSGRGRGIHAQRSAAVRLVSNRVPMIGDKFCLSGDHQVLTLSSGWVPIANIRVSQHKVACRTAGGIVVFLAPTRDAFSFVEERSMVLIKAGPLELLATEGHRMFVGLGGPSLFGTVPAGRLLLGGDALLLHSPRAEQIAAARRETKVSVASSRPGRDPGGLRKTDVPYLVRSDQMRRVPFRGPVHCLEVPTHIFYVRRGDHGLGVWTGNSSRHGQKGVVGMLVSAEDMPRTASGLVPDVIMNPHALPSRMTIGQLFEMYLSKVCAMRGEIGDGTPFRGVGVADIDLEAKTQSVLHKGKETMYCGKTGELLANRVFVGCAYYQRLKHMVQDKIHARGKGPRQILTRQPLEGRSRKGGLRLGEMERDALLSHGIADTVLDRFLTQSDEYSYYVCQTCKHMADPPAAPRSRRLSITHAGRPFCRFCKSRGNIALVRTPYTAKLLQQELQGLHLGVKLSTRD
jgi:DNA-directed RNA polymerase II subunit RPB2